MMLSNNFEEILSAFNHHQVEYIIAGGLAVVFHGYGRITPDLDIWIEPTIDNREKIISALIDLKFPLTLTDYIQRIENFEKPFAIKLGDDLVQVDIFNAITGVIYIEAKQRAVSFKFTNKLECKFISLQDLIMNRLQTGKPRNAADVEELFQVNKYSKDKYISEVIQKLFPNK